MFSDSLAVGSTDVDLCQAAGQGIEPGGKDDAVELDDAVFRADSGGRDLFSGGSILRR
jgi:hypothetical protein